MTENPTVEEMQNWNKKYKLDADYTKVLDTIDGGEYWTTHPNEAYNLCIELNKLYDENEWLKKELDCFKSSNDILQKELIKKVEEKAKLRTQNQGLQFKIIDMLDFVKDKGTVTREEIKEWWNNSQRGDNL